MKPKDTAGRIAFAKPIALFDGDLGLPGFLLIVDGRPLQRMRGAFD